ncbi:MAG: 2-hydroxychromene-2-carboxylate isomerase [Myxococcota bacterium]
MLEVYFDYRSPFPYLAIQPVAALAQRHGVRVDWLPIRLPALESYAERPMGHNFVKRNTYVGIDLQRWARRLGLEVRTPPALLRHIDSTPAHQNVLGRDHPLDTELALRGAVVARRLGCFDAYHRSLSRALWTDGEDVTQDEVVARAFMRAGADGADGLREAKSDWAGDELARLTREADERGVFGVPTFFVDGQMFWGQDRLDFVDEALAGRQIA